MTSLQIIGFILFVIILAVSFIPSKKDRELNAWVAKEKAKRKEEEKQQTLKLAEEVEHRRKIERQEAVEQEQKIREDRHQQYLELEKQIRLMPIYERSTQHVFKKCGNICQICGTRENLQAHHRISFYMILKHFSITSKEKAFECRQLWDVENGEILCKECHDKMESSKNRQSLTSKI